MTTQTTNRLASLKKKQEVFAARIQLLESSEKMRERKRETRRKILVGAYYLDLARQEGSLEDLKKKMDHFLTRPSDRVLFDLEYQTLMKNKESNS